MEQFSTPPIANRTIETSENSTEGKSHVKTVEIPGIGTLEYMEEIVHFPQDIIEKTGGVKGYIKKKIDWQNLDRLLISRENPEEYKSLRETVKNRGKVHHGEGLDEKEKELMDQFVEADSLKPGSKLTEVYKALTDGDFPNDMMTHRFNFYGNKEYSKKFADEGFLLQQISVSESEDQEGKKIKKYLPTTNIGALRNIIYLEVDKETNKVEYEIDQDFSDELKQGAILQEENKYLVTAPGGGFSLSNKKDSYTYKPNSATEVFFGFGQKNQGFMNYLSGMKEVYANLDSQIKSLPDHTERYDKYFNECVNNLEGTHDRMEGFQGSEHYSHPKIPLVINHDKVPNLRWCHATYASIPTEKNLNIIEMIS